MVQTSMLVIPGHTLKRFVELDMLTVPGHCEVHCEWPSCDHITESMAEERQRIQPLTKPQLEE